jgi:hypothetical protein
MNYQEKYLKYKSKYLYLKKIQNGGLNIEKAMEGFDDLESITGIGNYQHTLDGSQKYEYKCKYQFNLKKIFTGLFSDLLNDYYKIPNNINIIFYQNYLFITISITFNDINDFLVIPIITFEYTYSKEDKSITTKVIKPPDSKTKKHLLLIEYISRILTLLFDKEKDITRNIPNEHYNNINDSTKKNIIYQIIEFIKTEKKPNSPYVDTSVYQYIKPAIKISSSMDDINF